MAIFNSYVSLPEGIMWDSPHAIINVPCGGWFKHHPYFGDGLRHCNTLLYQRLSAASKLSPSKHGMPCQAGLHEANS
jgi:hypothetical protein